MTDFTHPQWSPDNRWIACTTTEGLTLVSPDGKSVKTFEDAGQGWIVYAWSQDAKTLYGVKQSEDSRFLSVVSLDIASGQERVLNRALAPLPPVNVPAKGFSRMSATSYATALVHLRSDIWLIDDFVPQQRLIDRLWSHLPS